MVPAFAGRSPGGVGNSALGSSPPPQHAVVLDIPWKNLSERSYDTLFDQLEKVLCILGGFVLLPVMHGLIDMELVLPLSQVRQMGSRCRHMAQTDWVF